METPDLDLGHRMIRSTSTVRVSTGNVPTQAQGARELGELLALPTKGKP